MHKFSIARVLKEGYYYGVTLLHHMITSSQRKKVNFMVDQKIVIELQEWIPQGQRSDFVNQALHEAMLSYKRLKAAEKMDELRKKAKIRMSTAEMIKLKNYGRP